MRTAPRTAAAATALAVVALLPGAAVACSTCFGDPAAAATQGLKHAVFLLLGVTGVVLAAVSAVALRFHRRTRALADRGPTPPGPPPRETRACHPSPGGLDQA